MTGLCWLIIACSGFGSASAIKAVPTRASVLLQVHQNTTAQAVSLSAGRRLAAEIEALEGTLKTGWHDESMPRMHFPPNFHLTEGRDAVQVGHTQAMYQDAPPVRESIKHHLTAFIFGLICISIALPLQWFNEERSVKARILLWRGIAECKSVSPDDIDTDNRGRLVHVQGKACGAVPVIDSQFPNAKVKHCIKLQSTVEAFEWLQTTKVVHDENKEKKSQPRFHTEWTPLHQDSARFRKPCPENPKLPSGLVLGTFTESCKQVKLGAFTLTDDMVKSFRKFELVAKRLPPKLTAHGLTWHANAKDGYYYARPGSSNQGDAVKSLFEEPQVGDVRARFLCVPESEATVVAVQCEKEPGVESFVPYRPITRPPCLSNSQARTRLIEEGDRPLKDFRRQATCCASAPCCAGCFFCPCKILASICKEEVITEEIEYVSDKMDPIEKPFERVVSRSPCRVWNFRLAGWGLMYLGLYLFLKPFAANVQGAAGLAVYGASGPFVLTLTLAMASAAFVMAAIHTCYSPMTAIKWLCAIGVIVAIPLAYGFWA